MTSVWRGSLPGRPLHEATGAGEGVDDEEETVEEAGTSVHGEEVDVVVLRDDVHHWADTTQLNVPPPRHSPHYPLINNQRIDSLLYKDYVEK